jgi:hypothetical protein
MRSRLLALRFAAFTVLALVAAQPLVTHAASFDCPCKAGAECKPNGKKPTIQAADQTAAVAACDARCIEVSGDAAKNCHVEPVVADAPPPAAPGSGSLIKLQNPLGANVTIPLLVGRIINAALGIVGSIAFLMFIFGGFKWLTSAGNEQKVREGTDVMKWAIVGLVIVFASVALVRFVLGSIGALG